MTEGRKDGREGGRKYLKEGTYWNAEKERGMTRKEQRKEGRKEGRKEQRNT